MATRTPRAWLMLITLAGTTSLLACTKPRVVTQPEPTDLIVLLPDSDDGKVGHVVVSNPTGTVELTSAYEGTRVVAARAPSAATVLDKSEIDRLFAGVLGSLPPAPRHFTLNFQLASEELTPESRALVAEVLQAMRERPAPEVIVVGHTDTTGTAASNYELGMRRAVIVRDLLVNAGLDASAVQVTSHGEGDLLVPTADNVQEPRNRRVEIDIQ